MLIERQDNSHGADLGEHAREEGEEIENLLLTAEEALAMVHSGEIEDAKTIVTLLSWASRRTYQ